MQEKKIPVVSIIFYVLAAVFFAYFIWAAVFSVKYISNAISQGQLMVDGFEFEIVSFIMTNAVQYLVYTALLFGAGWIIQNLQPLKSIEFEDEDFDLDDDWLAEIEEDVEEELDENSIDEILEEEEELEE